ncbi:chaperonin 10-like protein [Aspergillus karnatakaensis]|uniref:zinc-binding alcohol dehydrogenase family protein n=1 Tax=Aspergillus karnatakaensis TaxID=1810916 RepID=UPI003CCD551C
MSIPSSFKAASLPEKGARHTLTTRSPKPLDANEVGIRITATAINPVDWKVRDYGVFLQSYPAVLGSDAAGEIVAVGSNVSTFSVGDRVFFQGIITNYDASTFQEYCVMPAELVAKTPKSITDDQAAGVCLATVAGLVGLYDKTGHGLTPPPWQQGGERAGSGKAIVVLGGSSSVGQYVIQLARLSGYERIVTASSAAHHELLKTLGAHVVLDRKSAGAKDYVDAIGGLPLDVVFDSISLRDTQILGVEVLAAAGVASSVITVMPVNDEAKALGEQKGQKVEVRQIIGLGSKPDLRYLSEPLMKNLGGEDGWIATGKFRPNRAVLFEGGLEKIDDALDKNRAGVSGEKVVIHP